MLLCEFLEENVEKEKQNGKEENVFQDKELQNEIHVEDIGINVDEGNITVLASLFLYFIYFLTYLSLM